MEFLVAFSRSATPEKIALVYKSALEHSISAMHQMKKAGLGDW
jgi:hypothetical protein